MRLLLQITALTVMNLKSLPKRFWLSLSTVVAVMLVVVVLLAFLGALGLSRERWRRHFTGPPGPGTPARDKLRRP